MSLRKIIAPAPRPPARGMLLKFPLLLQRMPQGQVLRLPLPPAAENVFSGSSTGSAVRDFPDQRICPTTNIFSSFSAFVFSVFSDSLQFLLL